MSIRSIIYALFILVTLNSCVSKKIYQDLENEFARLKKDCRETEESYDQLKTDKMQLSQEKSNLDKQILQLTKDRQKLNDDLANIQNKINELNQSYDKLEKESSQSKKESQATKNELSAQLAEKEALLKAEQERLLKLKNELDQRSNRINELEGMIAAKEQSMKTLKETMSKALNNFEGKGLTVEQKNGKVYVSMENKLLFNTGSWAVNKDGKTAVIEVAKVLAANPEIAVLIEGHTDNTPFTGAVDGVTDNWSLSTKRAIAIVDILLQNRQVVPSNLTAAGRSEFAPLLANTTPENKAKNRRIEIILTPKLDEISKMLSDF
jgi:chemotaxis protein MotB